MSNLLDLIPVGAENAVPSKQLATAAGFPSVRVMQSEIHRLREKGNLILSSTEQPYGYYIAADPQEAARFVRSMQSRIREIRRAVRAAKKYASTLSE